MRQPKWSLKKALKLKHKLFTFSYAFGMSPQRMLLSAVLLAVVMGFICFLAFSGKQSASNDAAVSTHEAFLAEQQDIDQRLQSLLVLEVAGQDNVLFLTEKNEETETEILNLEASHSLTASQEELIARIRLKNKRSAVLMMKRHKISHDAERADMIRFCKSYEDADELTIRSESRYWLCALPAIEFSDQPSEQTLTTFSAAIEKYQDCFLNSPPQALSLTKILEKALVKSREESELITQCVRDVAQRMRNSDNDEVKSAGLNLALLEIFSKYDLRTLGSRIAWSTPSADDDLEQAIVALSRNLEIAPMYVWDGIINGSEGYLAIAEAKKVGVVWKRLWTLSEQVQAEKLRNQVQSRLKRQKHRTMSIGSTFNLSGARLSDGKPLDFAHGKYEYVAIIFYEETKESFELIEKVLAARKRKRSIFHSVLVYNEVHSQKIARNVNARDDLTVVSADTAKRYFEEHLVDIKPYIVLTDRSGKILSSGLQYEQIESRIMRLKSIDSANSAATN